MQLLVRARRSHAHCHARPLDTQLCCTALATPGPAAHTCVAPASHAALLELSQAVGDLLQDAVRRPTLHICTQGITSHGSQEAAHDPVRVAAWWLCRGRLHCCCPGRIQEGSWARDEVARLPGWRCGELAAEAGGGLQGGVMKHTGWGSREPHQGRCTGHMFDCTEREMDGADHLSIVWFKQ